MINSTVVAVIAAADTIVVAAGADTIVVAIAAKHIRKQRQLLCNKRVRIQDNFWISTVNFCVVVGNAVLSL